MSRTDPHKKKPREPQKTLLIVCEGETEYAFVKYLKGSYFSRSSGHIQIENAYGGDPTAILRYASKILAMRHFDRCLVVFDSDRMGSLSIPKNIHRTSVTALIPRPCIENLFLRTIRDTNIPNNTEQCKREFDKKYLGQRKKTDPATYAALFPMALLERRRHTITELDLLISIIKNCGW